ncbi:hypothetical protein RMSM_02537 [Rhodopirellula maiorica SM1]|uniref:Uncharacterized protein n=1 Tax=Rhodopirellula maiorica SM1 TaxID=1265738 RepID=M5RMH3_9BACT|nr:DUF1580 domain-containing protein [Rhodopirellula maiorica]EMI20505.1 hypothetical protein RMSM_02537 [Rhodopirellula maiorica SM1]
MSTTTNGVAEQMIASRDIPAAVQQITGLRPHYNTIRRWRTIGICGVRLKTRRIGGRVVTSRDWLEQFFDDVTFARQSKSTADGPHHGQCSPAAKRRNERAKAKLKAKGLL